jgi:opacity protein-like surface antigen
MKRAAQLALTAAVLLGAAAAAHADPDESGHDWSRNGLIVAAGGYYQMENYDDTCENGVDGDGKCIDGFRPDSSGGVAGHLGYRFHPWFAADLMVEWVKDALEDDFEESGYVVTANLRAIWPLGRWQPYALLGTGYMRAPVPRHGQRAVQTENGMAFRFGGGFDLWATEHWALYGEVSYVQPAPINDLDEVPYLSVGGGFQFRY